MTRGNPATKNVFEEMREPLVPFRAGKQRRKQRQNSNRSMMEGMRGSPIVKYFPVFMLVCIGRKARRVEGGGSANCPAKEYKAKDRGLRRPSMTGNEALQISFLRRDASFSTLVPVLAITGRGFL